MRCIALLLLVLPLMSYAQTTIKISTLYPSGSEAVTSLQALADEVAEKSSGLLRLKVYPGGVMGDDDTVMRKIRIGQLQGALVSAATLEELELNVSDLSRPFQYDSLTQVYDQREQVDALLRARLQHNGWQGYGPLDGGFSYLMSKQPIDSMLALRNAKLWLPNTASIQQMSRELNVNYLVMGIGDVLTGLDTGAIDSLIAPPSAALTLNWHSRFKFFTQTPVIYTWGMLVLPEKVVAKLPLEQQELLQNSLTRWAENLDTSLRSSNQNALSAIRVLLRPQSFNEQDISQLRLSQR